MEKKEQKENRFTYFNDKGLKVLSEQDIIDGLNKETIETKKEESKEIKKSIWKKWL